MVSFWSSVVSSSSRLLVLEDVERCVDMLRADQLVVLPTETGYLLAGRAFSRSATEKVLSVKARSPSQVMHVACSSLTMVDQIASPSVPARRVISALTPGPVSVVVNARSETTNEHVVVDGTIGIRVPDSPATLQVISSLGEPVTATSLNHSGAPATTRLDQVQLEGVVEWPDEQVGVVNDDQCCRYLLPSTLVRITDNEPEILRPGPITLEAITRACQSP